MNYDKNPWFTKLDLNKIVSLICCWWLSEENTPLLEKLTHLQTATVLFMPVSLGELLEELENALLFLYLYYKNLSLYQCVTDAS